MSSSANDRGHGADERRQDNDRTDTEFRPGEHTDDDEQNQNTNKGHGPLKGTDTAATTNAEDLEKAKRTTM